MFAGGADGRAVYRPQALRVRDLAGKAVRSSGGVGSTMSQALKASRRRRASFRRWPSPSSRRLPPYPLVHQLGNTVNLAQRAIGSFARFIPEEIVRRVIDNSISTKPGGVKQEITLVFTDVEGFTTIAESADRRRADAADVAVFLGAQRSIPRRERHGRQVHRRCGDGVLKCAQSAIRPCRARLPRGARRMKYAIDGPFTERKAAAWLACAHGHNKC